MTPSDQARAQLQLATTADVAAALGTRLRQINYWFYASSIDERYRSFELKRWGDRPPRIIEAPIKPIKDIQRRLLILISGYYRRHHAVHGYVKGRSILTNARVHLRQRWVLRVDLTDFFPSINFGRVRGLFLSAPFAFSPPVATLLAHMCCHRNHLPQGAPTSPLISNLICRGLDRQLTQLAISERCYYSRYCDDLTFSSKRRTCPSALAQTDPQTGSVVAGSSLRGLIVANGFTVNDGKTHLRSYSQRQVVTGLVTNTIVNVPRNQVRSLRTLLYIWKTYGEAVAAASLERYRPKNRPPLKPPAKFRLVVRGKLQYVGFIKGWDSPVYRTLAERLHAVDPLFVLREPVRNYPATTLLVFVEGKTDQTHLETAHEYFKSVSGSFAELDLIYDATQQGAQSLYDRCKILATVDNVNPMVFIFDTDNAQILPKVTDPNGLFKNWGKNVFSFALPVPSHRKSEDSLCIEMLYPDELLRRRDSDGRRLFLRSEFNKQTGFHPTENVVCQNIQGRTLVREDGVFDRTTGEKVSLSKQAFAVAISGRQPPFADVRFDGFRPVFEILAAIRGVVLARSQS